MNLRPIAFMIMPYGTRSDIPSTSGALKEVAFEVLWDKVYKPVLKDLGYEPIRADGDLGGLILKEMLERLVLSDLVLADITMPNPNVYYEVGVRHAVPRQSACVLLAADWAKIPFDLLQVPHIPFPNPTSMVSDAEARNLVAFLGPKIKDAANRGTSPVPDALPGYPDPSVKHASSFRSYVDQLAAFQGRIIAIRQASPNDAVSLVQQLTRDISAQPAVSTAVALELLHLNRDKVGWDAALKLIESFPDTVRTTPYVREQYALALGKTNRHLDSITELLALVQLHGETEERCGLVGGRYKSMYNGSQHPADKQRYLSLAIQYYEKGMNCDLNAYFCAGNLARLYRERGANGDDSKAHKAAQITLVGCERAMKRNQADEWLRPTLLGSAFDAGDADEAERLATQIISEGPEQWRLAITLEDCRRSIGLVGDPGARDRLQAVYDQLCSLV